MKFNGEVQKHLFDFLVVCTGLYEKPYVPTIENSSKFQGVIYHTQQITDKSMLAGKRVLVVGDERRGGREKRGEMRRRGEEGEISNFSFCCTGCAKSAADLMMVCAEVAESTHMIFRYSPTSLFPPLIHLSFPSPHLLFPSASSPYLSLSPSLRPNIRSEEHTGFRPVISPNSHSESPKQGKTSSPHYLIYFSSFFAFFPPTSSPLPPPLLILVFLADFSPHCFQPTG